MERDYPPLPSSCVRNLVDKLFEKRKLATPEIERITKEAVLQDRLGDVKKLIGYFGQDFIMSPNPHTRKGGLLGLASVAIGLGQEASIYYGSILLPVIRTFHDTDPRVRYYACETLYNIMKITRKETLKCLSEIFDAISRAVADSDLSVRQGASQCDRLLKEIVTEPDHIDMSVIISLLRDRIYTNNPYARQFIVSWTMALYSIPGLKLTMYLPQLLDGLFRILGDSNPDIRRQCEILLNDLLNEIKKNPSEVKFDAMINILIVHCRLSATACAVADGILIPGTLQSVTQLRDSSTSAVTMDPSSQSAKLTQTNTSVFGTALNSTGEQLQQRTALTWIQTFVDLDSAHLLPFASGIIGAVLPCFLLSNNGENMRDRRGALETAVSINETLVHFVNMSGRAEPEHTENIRSNLESLQSVAPKSPDLDKDSDQVPSSNLRTRTKSPASTVSEDLKKTNVSARSKSPDQICTDAILEATCRLLDHRGLLTRLAALRWIEVLSAVRPKGVVAHVVRLLPLTLNILSDPADEMVHSAIALVGNLCRHPSALDLLDEASLESLNIPDELLDSMPSPSTLIRHSSPVGPVGRRMVQSDRCSLFCVRFLLDLVCLFDKNPKLLAQRGEMIITDFCQVLGADTVYQVMSAIITHTPDLQSTFVLVQTLNRILLTQPSLHDFRNQLRAISTEDECHLLERLYRAWCQNPVALLSLLMLTQNYPQCSRLIKSFCELNITVDILVEMDQLIQMIESPIFATLRMHLLDRRYSADLRETLYCLLMCIPQTEAFQILWRRLQCLPPVVHLSEWQVTSGCPQPDFELINQHVDFNELLEYFRAVQKRSVYLNLSQPVKSSTGEISESPLKLPGGFSKSEFNNSGINTRRSRSSDSLASDDPKRTRIHAVGSAYDFLNQSLSNLGIDITDRNKESTAI
ncbi:unnamed protein product [Calicophoron daubneyi]|uniref:Protein VAC14 homolog n=1 Tax=Calicophoron daubneyi TaxID=300641 RepID=A0AAV2TN93_CALDB